MRQLKISASITKRDSPSLQKYLSEVSKKDMVTPEEEIELTKKIREGDEDALRKLTTANLRFVISVAKQYQGRGLELIDLISEGNIGMIKAARKFDETRGFKFISFAVWWIRQAIQAAISDQSRIVRLPMNQVGMLNAIKNNTEKFEGHNDREPTPEELAEMMDIDPTKIYKTINAGRKYQSLDAPVSSQEDSQTMLDTLSDDLKSTDNDLIFQSMQKDIERAIKQGLSDRERKVIAMYFGFTNREYTLDEIGMELDLTRERVRQIKEKAIRKLRGKHKGVRFESLKEYL